MIVLLGVLLVLFSFQQDPGSPGWKGPKEKIRITDQRVLYTEQNTPISISLGDLTVEADAELNYPTGFFLEIDDGKHYTVSGQTITPDSDFTGELKAKLLVTNGREKSKKFDLKIEVKKPAGGNTNSPPIMTGQKPLAMNENESLTIHLSDLIVTDADDSYPDDFRLLIYAGSDYTFEEASITPRPGFSGMLSVKVRVSDGKAESNEFNLKIDVKKTTVIPNQRPVISGQLPLSMNKNASLKIELIHLVVTDPDNSYPSDFKLILPSWSDANYTTHDNTITPSKDFTGTLTVKVKVNDGISDSEEFELKITVSETPSENIKPSITGQSPVTTFKNESYKIQFDDLSVADADNKYPDDFMMVVLPGDHYTVSGTTVMPVQDFVGVLEAGVQVNDGKDNSDVFNFSINVVEKDIFQITGHHRLTVAEDSVLTLSLSDLKVNDPSNVFPEGFTLRVLEGTNYSVSGQQVRPAKDFYGNLLIKIAVSQAGSVNNYEVRVAVTPVNDPPEFSEFSDEPVILKPNEREVAIASEIKIRDADDNKLMSATVSFSPFIGSDEFLIKNDETIETIYKPENGSLTLSGEALLRTYEEVLKSIRYYLISRGDSMASITVSFQLYDGKDYSKTYTKELVVSGKPPNLNIPTAFTPNNDAANDTWQIRFENYAGKINSAQLRIYNKAGLLLFESDDLEKAWDGKLDGEFLPADTYFYTLNLNVADILVPYHGIVTIIR
jgi:gliding motility-associated-like protein